MNERKNFLKKVKKEKKLTIQDISDLSGIPKGSVQNIFCGYVPAPRIDTVQAIEKALGLEKEKAPTDLTDGELKLILSLRVMSQEKREMVMSMFNAVLNAQTND